MLLMKLGLRTLRSYHIGINIEKGNTLWVFHVQKRELESEKIDRNWHVKYWRIMDEYDKNISSLGIIILFARLKKPPPFYPPLNSPNLPVG